MHGWKGEKIGPYNVMWILQDASLSKVLIYEVKSNKLLVKKKKREREKLMKLKYIYGYLLINPGVIGIENVL